MIDIAQIKREARQHLRLEWYKLYLLPDRDKTKDVRARMARIAEKHRRWA